MTRFGFHRSAFFLVLCIPLLAIANDFTVNDPLLHAFRLTAIDQSETHFRDNAVQLELPSEPVSNASANIKPLADAGFSQTVIVGESVTLDGSQSADVDGDTLTFFWAIISRPENSTAALSDSTAVKPSFTVDQSGAYEIQLTVNDGTVDSKVVSVFIGTENTAPIANAGEDFSAPVTEVVQLDGSLSSDFDGNAITYQWSIISSPEGSVARLTDSNTPTPTLTLDLPGSYVAQLTVNDGLTDSPADIVTISTINSRPVADAGDDQTVLVNSKVVLDGTNSGDADSDALSYRWAVIARPAVSNAGIASSSSAQTTVTIDTAGIYVFQLIVNDGLIDSLADTVVITTDNSRPQANAGKDETISIGSKLKLDGTLSSDADGEILAYQWSILYKPETSSSTLSAGTTAKPELIADKPGIYILQLIVFDASQASIPDTVVITAAPAEVKIKIAANTGIAPFQVSLNAVPSGGFPPYEFQWDLVGNGTIDDQRKNFVHTYTQSGDYYAILRMRDARGNAAVATELIRVNAAPVVIASATPESGPTPLSVSFGAIASDTDGIVVVYNWDFDGDGVIDQSSAASAKATYTYQQAGRYHAKVTVYDNEGISNSAKVVISVGTAPEVTANADNLTGVAPLSVNFSGTAVDQDGKVVLYEWDFDGDKQFDHSSEASAEIAHNYPEGGLYKATLRVTDNDGLIDEDSLLVSVSGPPVALPRAYPLSGVAPLKVTFFAKGKDLDGGLRSYKWDFDGNGTFEQETFTSHNTSHTYEQPGIYQAVLKVTDNDGVAATAALSITVKENAEAATEPTIIVAQAAPAEGNTPLAVLLSGLVTEHADTIVNYQWDFESDGVFDFSEEAGQAQLITEIIDVGIFSRPAFADFDGDGDQDLMIGNDQGQISYFRNSGNTDFFKFVDFGPIHNGAGNTIDVGGRAAPFAYDIDGDKDYDLLVGNGNGLIYAIENTGMAQTPDWENNGPLKLADGANIDVGGFASPIVYSIGNDGDWDLLVGNSAGVMTAFENTGSDDFPVWVNNGELQDREGVIIDVGGNAAPWLIDHNGNGVTDLYVGNSNGRVIYLENKGNNPDPVWVNQGFLTDAEAKVIGVGQGVTPAIVSTSGANVVDLWCGNNNGQLSWYQSSSSGPKEWKLKSNAFNSTDVGSYAAPALVDYDNNGTLDLVVGNDKGNMQLILNKSTRNEPLYRWEKFLTIDDGRLMDMGSYASPAFFDLDNDGDQDLISGESNGKFGFYANTGSASAAKWMYQGLITDVNENIIDIGSYSSPYFFDLDGDGDQDILAGNKDGQLYSIKNNGTVNAPDWVLGEIILDETDAVIDVGSYAKPLLTDFNADGKLDLLIGAGSGVIYHYENSSGALPFIWVLKSKQLGQADIGNNAAPVAVNLDGDVDEDLLIGNSAGLIYQLKSYGIVEHQYAKTGGHTAVLSVTDNKEKTTTDTVEITVLPAGDPVLSLQADVSEGYVPLAVNFSAKANDSDGSIVSYEWDFDGDGVYERSGAAKEIYTYTSIGVFNPSVRITDNDGKQAIKSVPLKVKMAVGISHNAVINSDRNGASAIQTALKADARITLNIVDDQGNIVKTLVDDEFRKAGTFIDRWDASDALNNRVADGAYYYVLKYSHNGAEGIIDARATADYAQFAPSKTWSSAFNPYHGIPGTITYTINKPSEVSLTYWVRDGQFKDPKSIVTVRNFLIREIKTAGIHTEVWDGVDDRGVPVRPGKQYPTMLWAYELPENAIVVKGSRPVISNLDVDNRVFSPIFNPYSAIPNLGVTVHFEISKNADVDVMVIDSQGIHIDQFKKPGLPAGPNTIDWDGRDADDELMPPGVYSIQLTAADHKGITSIPRYAVVTVKY
jgi:PKD repeat protein